MYFMISLWNWVLWNRNSTQTPKLKMAQMWQIRWSDVFFCFTQDQWRIIKRSALIEMKSKPSISINDGKLIVHMTGRNISFWELTAEEQIILPEHIAKINSFLSPWNGVLELLDEVPERINHILIHEGKLYESFWYAAQ